MSGRPKAKPGRPEASPCRLCGDLAQPTIHFDAGYWAGVKESAERVLAEVAAEMAEADKHLRMLAAAGDAAARERLEALLERR